jgi:SAM-dependent methyltransferase
MAHALPAAPPAPSPWVVRFAPLIAPGARVLDLACGEGRHARFLAGAGHPVLAVDRDAAALAALGTHPGVVTRQVDLEAGAWPLAGERFAAIVVTRYLYRPILGALVAALDDDGILLYETFAAGNEAYGRPANPEFLLREDELLASFGGRLRVVAFEQGRVQGDGRACVLQRIAAVGRARAWPPPLPEAAAGRDGPRGSSTGGIG